MADDDVLPLNPLAQRYLEQCFLGSTKDAPRVSRLASLLQDALLLPAAPVPHRRRSLRHRNRHNIRLREAGLGDGDLLTLQLTLLAMLQVYAEKGRQLDLIQRPAQMALKCLLQQQSASHVLMRLVRLQALHFLEEVFRQASLASWRRKDVYPVLVLGLQKFMGRCTEAEWSDPELMHALFETCWHAIVRATTHDAFINKHVFLAAVQNAVNHVGLGWHEPDLHRPGVLVATAGFRCMAEVLRMHRGDFSVVTAFAAVTAGPLPRVCATAPDVLRCLHWFFVCLTYVARTLNVVHGPWDHCVSVAVHCLRGLDADAMAPPSSGMTWVRHLMGFPSEGSVLVWETPRGALLQTRHAARVTVDPGLTSVLALLLLQLMEFNYASDFPSLQQLASEQCLIVRIVKVCALEALGLADGWHRKDFYMFFPRVQDIIAHGLRNGTLARALASGRQRTRTHDMKLLLAVYLGRNPWNTPPFVEALFALVLEHAETVDGSFEAMLADRPALLRECCRELAVAANTLRRRWNSTRVYWIEACIRASCSSIEQRQSSMSCAL